MLPVLAAVSLETGLPPLMLMAPATLSAPCAFRMPTATPPNTVVFGADRWRSVQMARAGLFLNIIRVWVVTAAVFLFGGILIH
ncbi:MAG: anion permease [Candidatus Marinimicrobia bacterium]|nr:anion permease [Candidatus Neomarinimicrobiota bacterium]